MSVPPENMPPAPSSFDTDPLEPPVGEERTWGMLAHLSSLLGALITGTFGGWGCFLGPLIVWLIKKDTMPFVNDQGKEALNFNITIAISLLVLLMITILTLGFGLLITVPLWVIIGIYWVVCTIIGSVKANHGVAYRYPLTFRFLR